MRYGFGQPGATTFEWDWKSIELGMNETLNIL